MTGKLSDWKQRRQHSRHQAATAQAALDAAGAESAPQRDFTYRTGVTLSELRPGDCGTVHHFLGAPQTRLRLLEMGLIPGTHLRMLRAASFGGPIEIQVRGYQLSLRREEAALIWLAEDDDAPEMPPAP